MHWTQEGAQALLDLCSVWIGGHWEAFEEEYAAARDLRPSSREKYVAVLDVFEQVIGPKRLGDVTTRAVNGPSASTLDAVRRPPRADGRRVLHHATPLVPVTEQRTALMLQDPG